MVLCCTKFGAAPHAGVRIAAARGGTSFRGCSLVLCSSAAAPPNLQCGAALFFCWLQRWQSSEPASTWFARCLSTPGDYSFRGQDSQG